MKYLRCVVATLLIVFVLPAQAQRITVDGVKDIWEHTQSGLFSSRAEWNALTYYLQGVVEGAAAYHEGLERSGTTLLFCPPEGKGYSIEEILTILDQTSNEHADRPASLVLLEAYAKTYPCD